MRTIGRWLGLLLVVVLVTSCSEGGKVKSLLERIPANTDVVVVGNMKTIVESADGTIEGAKVTLPALIANQLSETSENDWNEFSAKLAKSGVDAEACALAFNFESEEPYFVVSLTDKDQFVNLLKEEGCRQTKAEGDLVLYANSDTYAAVFDSYAYVGDLGSKAVQANPSKYFKGLEDKAAEKSYAETAYGQYMMSGNAGGVAFVFPEDMKQELRQQGVPAELLPLYDGVFCLRASLSDDDCTMEGKVYDKQGNEMKLDALKQFMDVDATINKDVLSLLGKGEYMLYAISMKNVNWDKYSAMLAAQSGMSRADQAQLNALMAYFEKIDGTVAFSFGLTNGMESFTNINQGKDVMRQFSTTVVAETKEGKAKQLVEDMKGMLEKMSVPFKETATGFSISLSNMDVQGEAYVEAKGNMLVFANHPINANGENKAFAGLDLGQYNYAFSVVLDKDNKLMRDLGGDHNLQLLAVASPKTMEGKMTLHVEGDGGKGVLAKLANLVMKIDKKTAVR